MNILEKIVADKRIEVSQRLEDFPLEQFEEQLTPSDRDFKQALVKDKQNKGAAYILECKKASPSKGLIRPVFDLDEICHAYKQYASCVSVLTDEKYFQGEFERLPLVRERLPQPVLCKDFFVDEYQVYLARYFGANAILLMLSVLTDDEYQALEKVARSLGMAILTEVSNAEEMQRAVALKADILGINNRNLRDLSTDLNQTPELISLFDELTDDVQKAATVLISESGIYHHQQVKLLSQYVAGFLVGSSLMAEKDLVKACRSLCLGEQKVCGLTREQDVNSVTDAGANYAGLIFVEKSPRNISIEQAKVLTQSVSDDNDIKFAAVTQNMPIEEVLELTQQLPISVIQLHGAEDQNYIDTLRAELKQTSQIEIWKAIAVSDSLPNNLPTADKLLLDTKSSSGGSGGTGRAFDWSVLQQLTLDHPPVLLAGGLNPDNVEQARSLPVNGFDLNSGVEIEPGIKSAELINQAFNTLNGLN